MKLCGKLEDGLVNNSIIHSYIYSMILYWNLRNNNNDIIALLKAAINPKEGTKYLSRDFFGIKCQFEVHLSSI